MAYILIKMILFCMCALFCVPFIKHFMNANMAMDIMTTIEGYVYEMHEKGCITESQRDELLRGF